MLVLKLLKEAQKKLLQMYNKYLFFAQHQDWETLDRAGPFPSEGFM